MNIRAFVLHHTATGTGNSMDGSDIVESIGRSALLKTHGRFGHYYHVLIGPTGKTFHVLPWNIALPHCGIDQGDRYQDGSGVNNQNSVAICCIGNFQLHDMPERQYLSLLKICRKAKENYPQAFFKLHRELVNTLCPGQHFPHRKLFEDVWSSKVDARDVPPNAWFAPAVGYCLEKKIMSLDPQLRFHPQKAVSRAEIAQIVLNLCSSLNQERLISS